MAVRDTPIPSAFVGTAVVDFPSMVTTRLLIVRHGRSVWNHTKRVTGQLDPPLSEVGYQQAHALADALRDEPLTAIYTSDLMRSIATAQPVARFHDLSVQWRAALRELHLGVLQGRFRDQRDPEAAALWQQRKGVVASFRPPGGESYDELMARVAQCLAEILVAEAGGTVLIVGHRNTNRALLAALLGWPPSRAIALRPRPTRCYEVVVGAGRPRVSTLCLDRDGAPRLRGVVA